jgi:hypothetical protein
VRTLRLGIWVLSVVLVVAPVLAGVATADRLLHTGHTYPRHGSSHVSAPHLVGKAMPAAVASSRPTVAGAVRAAAIVDAPASIPSIVPRPPFTPPRV